MVLFIPGFYKHGAPDLAFACSGVGLYTGAAMASIAAGESVAVVDANVMRFSFSLNSSGGPQHMILYSRNGRAMHRLNAVSMPCKGERGGGGGGHSTCSEVVCCNKGIDVRDFSLHCELS